VLVWSSHTDESGVGAAFEGIESGLFWDLVALVGAGPCGRMWLVTRRCLSFPDDPSAPLYNLTTRTTTSPSSSLSSLYVPNNSSECSFGLTGQEGLSFINKYYSTFLDRGNIEPLGESSHLGAYAETPGGTSTLPKPPQSSLNQGWIASLHLRRPYENLTTPVMRSKSPDVVWLSAETKCAAGVM
jgi:hypothetical protein